MRGSVVATTELSAWRASGLLTPVSAIDVAPTDSELGTALAPGRRLPTVSTPLGLWIGAASVVLGLVLAGLVGLRSIDQRQTALATV